MLKQGAKSNDGSAPWVCCWKRTVRGQWGQYHLAV